MKIDPIILYCISLANVHYNHQKLLRGTNSIIYKEFLSYIVALSTAH